MVVGIKNLRLSAEASSYSGRVLVDVEECAWCCGWKWCVSVVVTSPSDLILRSSSVHITRQSQWTCSSARRRPDRASQILATRGAGSSFDRIWYQGGP